jgi:hypothetical protein
MDFRTPAERDRLAILRRDRRIWMSAAPLLRKASNWVVGIWAALLAVYIYNQAEGVILLAVAAVPVGLFWMFGRFATKWAAYVDKHWA